MANFRVSGKATYPCRDIVCLHTSHTINFSMDIDADNHLDAVAKGMQRFLDEYGYGREDVQFNRINAKTLKG